jgi:hypothetical protein
MHLLCRRGSNMHTWIRLGSQCELSPLEDERPLGLGVSLGSSVIVLLPTLLIGLCSGVLSLIVFPLLEPGSTRPWSSGRARGQPAIRVSKPVSRQTIFVTSSDPPALPVHIVLIVLSPTGLEPTPFSASSIYSVRTTLPYNRRFRWVGVAAVKTAEERVSTELVK